MMKTFALAAALTLSLGGAAFAQYNGPVNPGSGPTAGGVIGETVVRPQTVAPGLFPGLTLGEPETTGSIDADVVDGGARRNGAGPTAGGVIDEPSPFRR